MSRRFVLDPLNTDSTGITKCCLEPIGTPLSFYIMSAINSTAVGVLLIEIRFE